MPAESSFRAINNVQASAVARVRSIYTAIVAVVDDEDNDRRLLQLLKYPIKH
jgi:hypothetical protein